MAYKQISFAQNYLSEARPDAVTVAGTLRTALCAAFSAVIGVAIMPSSASAIPIAADDPTAVFKFVIPPVPDRGDKTKAPGGTERGWGGLFISFTTAVNTVTVAVDPVLADCVNADAIPVNDLNQFGAAPADAWLWKCRNVYLLDSVEHPGLTVTVTVTSDDPISILLDNIDAVDPMRTFLWQKQKFNVDGTLRFTGDTDPVKIAVFPAPTPGTLPLALGALVALLGVRVASARKPCAPPRREAHA